MAAATLDKAMSELDDDQHMPEGLNYDTWRKLVALRRLKVEKEQQVGIFSFIMGSRTSQLVLANRPTYLIYDNHIEINSSKISLIK